MQNVQDQASIYYQINGHKTLKKLVPLMFTKILDDQMISHYFYEVSFSEQILKETQYLVSVLGKTKLQS